MSCYQCCIVFGILCHSPWTRYLWNPWYYQSKLNFFVWLPRVHVLPYLPIAPCASGSAAVKSLASARPVASYDQSIYVSASRNLIAHHLDPAAKKSNANLSVTARAIKFSSLPCGGADLTMMGQVAPDLLDCKTPSARRPSTGRPAYAS